MWYCVCFPFFVLRTSFASMSVRARTYRGKCMYGNVLAPKIICQPLPSLVKEGERGIKYASLHFLCDSTYPGKRIFKMTEICQVHRDIAYLSQRKQKFLEHLRTFHWLLWSSFAQNIIQANHIKTLLIIHWINCFKKVIEF